ncbi:MAG: Sporulation initiation inhibitor protein Soj [Chlamydiae bacterium]|nr:Sporulation initiation inhibitor protein Soj [Chlamydiota bacterium]
MYTATFCSFKGGTAKTSTVLHIGAYLAKAHNKKVLLIDLDSQANLSIGMGIGPDEINTIVSVLERKKPIQEVVKETNTPNLHIVPSNAYLDGIERSPELTNDVYAHERLRKALKQVEDHYDYCFIDTPPSLGWLTQSAYLASQFSIICAVPEAFSVLALGRLKEFHDELNEHHPIQVLGVVLSFWNEKGAVNEEFLEIIEQSFPDALFKAKIRRDMSVSRAVLEGVPVFDYDSQSRAGDDYKDLSKEFLKRAKILTANKGLARV